MLPVNNICKIEKSPVGKDPMVNLLSTARENRENSFEGDF